MEVKKLIKLLEQLPEDIWLDVLGNDYNYITIFDQDGGVYKEINLNEYENCND